MPLPALCTALSGADPRWHGPPPAESVHMAVTSPPYWALRNYKIPPSVWGGRADCRHEWEDGTYRLEGHGDDGRSGNLDGTRHTQNATRLGKVQAGTCRKCGAWRGCLGLEPSIELYVEHLVHVFRLVRRVMRPEALLWLNLGDSYCSDGGADRMPTTLRGARVPAGWTNRAQPQRVHVLRKGSDRNPKRGAAAEDAILHGAKPDCGLKPKDLCGIPERMILALQADGWYWRSRSPWVKHNGMPESVRDRPTSMCEHLFMLAKSPDVYYDREAGRIQASRNTHRRGGPCPKAVEYGDGRHGNKQNRKFQENTKGYVSSRARRNSDWFFASLETYTPDFQGLLLDEEGDPLAMISNPQPFSVEMCESCETCYDRRDYRRLDADLACEDCEHAWRETGPKLSRNCLACGSKHVRHVRICVCGAKQWVSHFATFPERLVQPCIALGTSEYGCCSVCGAPYLRVVEKQRVGDWHPDSKHKHDRGAVNGTAKWAKQSRLDSKALPEGSQFSTMRMDVNTRAAREAGGEHDNPFAAPRTVGWRPSCSHPLLGGEPVPCTVLDPFAGSGRAGLAAVKMGRSFKGIEANPKYVVMAEWQGKRVMQSLKPEPRGTPPAVASPEPPSSLADERESRQ